MGSRGFRFACILLGISAVARSALPPVSISKTAVDSQGRIYVAGVVSGQVFSASPGAVQENYQPGTCVAMGFHHYSPFPCGDVFVMRLDPSGTTVDAATYLGGVSL